MNSEHAQREFEAYRRLDAEYRAIVDLAASETRDTTAEEDEQLDKLYDAAAQHKQRADKLVAMDRDGAALAEAVRSRIGDTTTADSGGSDLAVVSFDRQLIDNIRSVQGAFAKNGSFDGELWATGLVDLEKRAIADFSDSGALYTTDFATRVAVYQRTASPWIDLATVINADNGRPLNLPALTADPTVYVPGEGTAITESTPTIGSAALTTTAYKTLSYVSMEAEEDELVGLLQVISRVQGRAIGYQFGTALSASILTAAQNGGTATGVGGNGTAVTTFFGYDDLIDLKYSRAVPYRSGGAGAYVMATSSIKKVRKFADQNGAKFFQPAIGPGMPPLFDGDPVYEDPGLAAPASATKSVLYGDVSAVVIKQMALRVATSLDARFINDQVAIKTVYRAGGALPDAAALAYLVSANT